MLQVENRQVGEGATDRGSHAYDEEWRWQAVARRDAAADGHFVYAVTSTRIFCRPSCPSRRPHRDRVRFFATAAAATRAGFRACKRCRPASAAALPRTADAVRIATEYLSTHADRRVTLDQLARVTGWSAFHLQRRFKQVLGVSPREYQAARRAERFRGELRGGRAIADATYEAGYGSPSRVYEAPPTGRGMAPATYRQGGAGARIGYVTLRVPLGWLLVAATAKGVCAVKLGDSTSALETELRREFPQAEIDANVIVDGRWTEGVIERLNGVAATELPLDVRGTAFQWRVWRALQNIRPGETKTYSEVARAIGKPAAVRAVARACATNPVCAVIPCHRVVPKEGGLGGYRWGASRKARLLRDEKRKVTK